MALFSASADAGGNPSALLDAEAMIKDCFSRTIGKAALTTAANRAASADYNLCLEEKIVDQFQVFRPDLRFYFEPDDSRPTTDKVREQLEKLRSPIQGLYSWIYNSNPGCRPSCGTQFEAIHLFANGRILEQMLKDIIWQRNEYGF